MSGRIVWESRDFVIEEGAMKALRWSLGILLLVPTVSAPVRAQQAAAPAPSSTMSPGDATANGDAKPKKARVWDNDNIPKAGDEISVVGPSQPASDASASSSSAAAANGATASGNAAATAAPAANDGTRKTDKDARVEAAKQKLDGLKKDVELALRKFNLDSDTYYGKPDYATDPEGAQALKSEKDALQEKQDEVDAAQKELDQLMAELGDGSK
jgi:hypothetical protein